MIIGIRGLGSLPPHAIRAPREDMAKPPEFYLQMKKDHPELVSAYESLGKAARDAGPLDAQTQALVRLGLSIGCGMEGSTHSSTRKALDAGCGEEQIRQVVLLAVTTLGFPSMMRARAWVEDVLSKKASAQNDES